jgi:formylglycine-generating enzyme required for sulfatase activity
MKSRPHPRSHLHRDAASTLPMLKLSMPLPTFLLAALFSLALQAAVFAQSSVSLVTTLAGSGEPDQYHEVEGGFADGAGVDAKFNTPTGVAVDSSGNLYVADQENHRIRKVAPNGRVTTLAGSGSAGFADGQGLGASFYYPTGVAVDSSGNIYVADFYNCRIRKITSGGLVSTLAGGGGKGPNGFGYADGQGAVASFSGPTGVAVDNSGNVYVADSYNNRIRKITASGTVSTLAGSGSAGFDDGQGTAASFKYPHGVAVDNADNIYVADSSNNNIRKITPTGIVSTLAGSRTGQGGFGEGANARFSSPKGIVADSIGNVYVADSSNNNIRKITPTGIVSTLAGKYGGSGFLDANLENSKFFSPCGVAIDVNGNLYVADSQNHRIRKITISAPDTTAPVITLLGTNPQTIYRGSTFTDPEATVTDNVDASRTIAGNGSVDATKVGNYTLTYATTDVAGNVAQSVTRTINVVLDPNGDEDGDGLTNAQEVTFGTNSNLSDTDGDGVSDYREGKDGTDPNNASSFDPLSKGLVAYYPFNGNAKDESGNGRHANSVNAILSMDRFAAPNKAYDFNGVDSKIVASATGWPSGNSNRTVSIWINANAMQGNLFSFGREGPDTRFSVLLGWGGSQATAFVGPNSNFTSGNFAGAGWKHLTISWNNGTGAIYINGVKQTEFARTLNTDGSKPLVIGANVLDRTDELFSGQLDDVRIYNRALSAAEVSQLYNKESQNPNMVTVQGGMLPSSSQLAGQTVGTFQIGKYEVTWGEWQKVRAWALSNGYNDLSMGGGQRALENHPVGDVSWYDVLKWCNARSEKDGLVPVYTVYGSVYRGGEFGEESGVVVAKTGANGYRLPTEPEWEWAARGGILSQGHIYSGSNDVNEVAWWASNFNNYTSTSVVGTKESNELGIHDMSGNVFEWCWDEFIFFGSSVRRVRGGAYFSGNLEVSVAYREDPPSRPHLGLNGYGLQYPQRKFYGFGFRLARNSGTPPDTTSPVIAITSISANARLTSANATFGGAITETGSKPTLQYRLGTTGNWTSSTVGGSASPYSFSQLVALKPGPNTVQFQAKDDAGNTSTLASVNVSYVVASTLTITAPNAADGSVTSGFGGSSSREVGVSYTVTATPASGMLFKEWLKNGVSTSTNATLKFTMQPGLTLKPIFVPDFAKLGGFYNGLVGVGAIGNGTAADMQAFATNNGFLQITSGTNGALSGVLKIEGKSHSFTGTMGANKRATITVPRPGKGNATLSLSLVSALPGEISGHVTTSGAPLAFRALRAAYTAGAAKHALAGKRYAIVLPPPSGLAMGYGHATLTVEDNGAAVLSGVLANGQAVNAGARIVDDGAGNWVFPVYVGASGIFTGEIVIPKTTPASGSEIGGSLEWLKPTSSTGLFKSGLLKSLQPLGATHSPTSAGLGGAAFRLTLDPAKRILPAAVVQTGTWANSGSPSLATPVKSGLALSFNPLSGKFEGSFTRTVSGAPIPTPIQGTLFSRPIPIPGGATLRGAGFFTSGNASAAVEITSNGTAPTLSANMVTVQGGTLPSSSQLAGQTVATFQIGKYEVTWGEWKEVRDWAVANGYTDLANVGGTYPKESGDNFPVINVSWYDVVKWCNARSQKEGLTPVYQMNGSVYTSGPVPGTGQSEPSINNTATGYRLPLETEWEWAARGGIASQGYTYSGGNDLNVVGWFNYNSGGSRTWPVGQKIANELKIHDLSGNVGEWCWDQYIQNGSFYRRYRGGAWLGEATRCSVVFRASIADPYYGGSTFMGFRLARNAEN